VHVSRRELVAQGALQLTKSSATHLGSAGKGDLGVKVMSACRKRS
jgi:hypothetical protein